MESRRSWGIVYVAGAFALIVIGGAFFYSRSGGLKGLLTGGATVRTTDSAIAPTDGAEAIAPAQALSQDLYAGYFNLTQQGSFTSAERDQMLADIVKKDVNPENVVPAVTLANLNIASTTSTDKYLALLAVILNQASTVKRYELAVFTDNVAAGIKTGSPELAADADLYKRIAMAILIMQVPPALATQHLEVVKSVGALSRAVSNMAEWNGDPIQALAEADTFNKAQQYVTNSVNDVLVAGEAVMKKPS